MIQSFGTWKLYHINTSETGEFELPIEIQRYEMGATEIKQISLGCSQKSISNGMNATETKQDKRFGMLQK